MKITNLFKYATSELSQDAFICWLLSHLTEEGYDEDNNISQCAADFMKMIFEEKGINWSDDFRISEIKKQYEKIDVLVIINDLHIIIEDKTYTGTHGEQICKYKEKLISKGTTAENIICVYYKIVEQSKKEEDVDFEFTRKILLQIFRNYSKKISSPIFSDYLEYLEDIDTKTMAYQGTHIDEWDSHAYRGFFTELKEELSKSSKENISWGSVPNQDGGFMGLWWKGIIANEDYIAMGDDKNYITEVYLQLENNIAVVKYSINSIDDIDSDKVKKIRWKLHDSVKQFMSDTEYEFEKSTFRNGKFMSVGHIDYNKDNCQEILEKMAEALKHTIQNWK